jgi:AcrR family transcriptional regulator
MALMSPKPNPLAPSELRQKRSLRTRNRLVKAALRLFTERGYDATSTSQIAKRAGMSAGVFYRYFKDKRDIFRELYSDHSFSGAHAFTAELNPEKWRDADMRTVINSLVETVYTIHRANPRLQEQFECIELRDAEFSEERQRTHSLIQRRLEALLESRRDELGVKNIPVAAYLIKETVETCIHRSFRSETPFDEEALKAELAAMVSNYLIRSED